MKVLVVGGAGYIGSHTVLKLKEKNIDTVVVDNLSKGHRKAVLVDKFEEVNILDIDSLKKVFEKYKFDGVIHFAAHCLVGESIKNPKLYFEENLNGLLNILDCMLKFKVGNIIFSSSCAVYGNPQFIPLTEEHPKDPINPYGETKFFGEKILKRYEEAYGIKFISLRYFNAAGADFEGRIGESHNPETHLIPLVIKSILDNNFQLTVFGNDYNTKDGSCIRDYIHVLDLAEAHILALNYLLDGGTSDCINLGTGKGFSVFEIIRELEKISGKKSKYKIGKRREGDPPILVADNKKAKEILGWKTENSGINSILESAFKWHTSPKF